MTSTDLRQRKSLSSGHLDLVQPFASSSNEESAYRDEADLAGDNPTALERLLIERIVIAWMESHLGTSCASTS